MLRLHKPTSNNTGAAITFSINRATGHLYINLVKQAAWDSVKKTGSFAANVENPNASINIKLTELEMSAILDVLETRKTWNTVHNLLALPYMTQIKMGPRLNKEQQEEPGFSLSVTKKDRKDPNNKLWIPFSFSETEAVLVREHLKYLLNQSFSIRDAIAAENYRSKQNQLPAEAPPMDEPANENGSENYIPVQ